jgi:hypothetical protein
VLDYRLKAEHNRKMVLVALRFVADLESSIACKGGDAGPDPYPTVSAEQCEKDIPGYRRLAEYYRQLARTYDRAAEDPWGPAPVEPPRPRMSSD